METPDNIRTPKITFEAYTLPFLGRVSVMYMTDFKRNGSIMIRPEIGIGFDGGGVSVGYNYIPFKVYDQTPSYFVVSAHYPIFLRKKDFTYKQ